MKNGSEISLFSLCEQIRRHLAASLPNYVWIRAEINAIKETANGHCYLDLIDKEAEDAPLRAQARAVVWSSTWRMLRPYFESVTGRSLAVGMQVLLRVQVQYSELYGLTLVVQDIDPSCTVGEEELLRQRILARLKQEGMFEMNRTLPLPRLVRRVAVISSETAAGYLDFVRHLEGNEYGYAFEYTLFPAMMQGAEAPASIEAALDQVMAVEEAFVSEDRPGFDAVLILRGGGSATDLRCFDDYELAVHVAQFPLPVLTAIGHEQDHHIVDMVAARYLKTPTALAHFLIERIQQEEAMVLSLAARLALGVRSKLNEAHRELDRMLQRMEVAMRLRLARETHRLDLLSQRLEGGNPSYLLEKGYALVQQQGKKVARAAALQPEQELEIQFLDGVVRCQVMEVTQKETK